MTDAARAVPLTHLLLTRTFRVDASGGGYVLRPNRTGVHDVRTVG